MRHHHWVWSAVLGFLGSSSSVASAQHDDWYEDEQSSSSSASSDEYVAPPGLPSTQTSEGWGLGLRLGYALPFGDMVKDGKLDDFVSGAVKPQLDFSYGLDRSFVLGAYLALGGGLQPKSLETACELESVDCRLLLLESGLLAEYRILPGSLVNPWAGVNLGVEWVSNHIEADRGDVSVSFLGVGFGASAGADFQLGDVGLGPFVSLQVSRAMRGKLELDGLLDEDEAEGDEKIDKDERAYHYWLNIGLRVRYQFGP